jgi:paraquat-inducible protein A
LEKGIRARCSHCGTILYRNDPYYLDRTLALTVTGIILFIAANLFPLVRIDLFGNAQFVNIPIAIAQLLGNGFYLVGMGITLLVLVIPILVMGSYAVVLILLEQRRGRWIVRNLLVLLSKLLPWSMMDVFVISILVALVKLTGEVNIHLGVSFWALSLYVAVELYLTRVSRLGSLWEIYDRVYEIRPKTPLGKRSIRCPVCEAVNPDLGGDERCVRCGSRIYPAPRVSLGRSWAFLVTAMILYFPANYYPVLELKNVLYEGGNTIIGGVIQLWDQGSYVIALIILVSSVFIPILKFILLLYLFISVRYPVAVSKQVRHRLHAVIEVIGPWSMIDVFVVSILTGLVKYDSFNIVAGRGATVYVLMVFFTMLSALSFDPRLIQENPRNPQEVP